jgi:hypothetical protein
MVTLFRGLDKDARHDRHGCTVQLPASYRRWETLAKRRSVLAGLSGARDIRSGQYPSVRVKKSSSSDPAKRLL